MKLREVLTRHSLAREGWTQQPKAPVQEAVPSATDQVTAEPPESLSGTLKNLAADSGKLAAGVLGSSALVSLGFAIAGLAGSIGFLASGILGAMGGVAGGITGKGCLVDLAPHYNLSADARIGALTHQAIRQKTGSRALAILGGIPAGLVGDALKGAVEESKRQASVYLYGTGQLLADLNRWVHH